ncbi:MerR family transcriptional regulator [Microbacterium sp. PMB16]|uniref:MerR family transcriptional regulator n=1 Tax=Microbacterium sp. PMB16 TaxID=3120157 RepID=UPI003F4B6490
MRIGEVVQRTGATARSLRYYEKLGLIASERLSNGYRDYDESTVSAVSIIKSLLGLGFSTAVIADVLDCEAGGEASDCASVRSRASELKNQMEAQAEELLRRRDALAASLDHTPSRVPADLNASIATASTT